MSTELTILRDGLDELAVIDPDTGELAPLRDASDRALAHAAKVLAAHDGEVLAMKRAVAHELRDRHGVGKASAGGYDFTVAESQTWPVGATQAALSALVETGKIAPGDAERVMPAKPRPDGRALKALLGRLMVSDPDAARVLADAATVSPPSVREVREVAVDAPAAVVLLDENGCAP
jgi:hypothetical protein